MDQLLGENDNRTDIDNLDIVGLKDELNKLIDFLGIALNNVGGPEWSVIIKWPLGDKDAYKRKLCELSKEADDCISKGLFIEEEEEKIRSVLVYAESWYYRGAAKEAGGEGVHIGR